MISSLLGYPGQDVLRPKSREQRPCTVILCVLCTEIHSYPHFRPSYNDSNWQRPKRSIAEHTARHLEGLVISLSRLNLFRCLTLMHHSTQHAFHPKIQTLRSMILTVSDFTTSCRGEIETALWKWEWCWLEWSSQHKFSSSSYCSKEHLLTWRYSRHVQL